ncbi:MAG: TonB-dependent receptor, partial [Candidatus Korobacteraceae bacterium]
MALKCALAFLIMLLPAYPQTGNPAPPPLISTSPGARTAAGTVVNARGEAIAGAKVTASPAEYGAQSHPAAPPATTLTDPHGHFVLTLPAGPAVLKVSGQYVPEASFSIAAGQSRVDLVLRVREVIPPVQQSIVISATTLEPENERRNDAIYKYTLFNRDDQIFDTLAAGINAGQHEGGGKSLEVRRFGFNLDHGGINGGLKVLVDDVQQNQSTQGHGQGYLGQLKSLTPELVEGVDIINGPFSAEYGDFSGLGVVHIRLKESLP